MIGGLIIVPLVSLVTPSLPESEVNEKFACYEKEVVVKTKDSLGKD